MDVARQKRIKRNWPGVFAEFHRSGLSIKEFCRVQGMSQSLFYRRRKDYSYSDRPTKTLRPSDFIELTPASSARRSAAIVFDGRIELSISNDCDRELLRGIISQLKGSSC